MKLHSLQLAHKDYYSKESPLIATAKVEMDNGLEMEIKFLPEDTAMLAQAAAELVGKMVRQQAPQISREKMKQPHLALGNDVIEAE